MQKQQKLGENVELVVEFFGHALVGTMIFMVIGVAGLAVEKFVALLVLLGMSVEAVKILTLMTHVLMVADVALLAVWVVASTVHALRGMLEGK